MAHGQLQHWLVISLIVGVVGQAAVMAQSRRLFDAAFDLAHLRKIAAYGAVLTGLLANVAEVFKEVERAARQTEARYQRLFESVPVGLFRADLRGRLLEANARLGRILGFSDSHALLRRPLVDSLAGVEDRDRGSKSYDAGTPIRGFVSEPPLPEREDGRRPATESLWIDVNAEPIRDSGQRLVGFEGLVQDITQRERAERALEDKARELERSNAELEQFAYVASHDLQEPLRTVASYMQLLERRYANRLDDDAREFIGFAVDGARRMRVLVNDLLAYSRVGTHAKSPAPSDAGQSLARALEALGAAVAESGTVVTREPLPRVTAAAVQLDALFQNLISNAIKFRRQEPARIHISARRSGTTWIFSVRDDGIGIEPRYQERVFAIFQRLHTRDEYPGTGIGLAKLVERHGGRTWIESQPGVGTTFFFTLREAVDDTPPRQPRAA